VHREQPDREGEVSEIGGAADPQLTECVSEGPDDNNMIQK